MLLAAGPSFAHCIPVAALASVPNPGHVSFGKGCRQLIHVGFLLWAARVEICSHVNQQ